jgi:spore coat-associated protein N
MYPEWQPLTARPLGQRFARGEPQEQGSESTEGDAFVGEARAQVSSEHGDMPAQGAGRGGDVLARPAPESATVPDRIDDAEVTSRVDVAPETISDIDPHIAIANTTPTASTHRRSVKTSRGGGRTRGLAHIHRHSRIMSVLVVVMIAVLGMGIGAFAMFYSSSSTTAAIGGGSVGAEWVSTGTASLAVPVDSILPGQSVHRHVELRNSGTLAITELQLMISADSTNNSDGLQLAISDCSVPWSGTTSLSCGGVETVVSAERPLSAVIPLHGLGTNEAGGSDYLRLAFRLPETAPTSLQSTSTTVYFEILANHGPGKQR